MSSFPVPYLIGVDDLHLVFCGWSLRSLPLLLLLLLELLLLLLRHGVQLEVLPDHVIEQDTLLGLGCAWPDTLLLVS